MILYNYENNNKCSRHILINGNGPIPLGSIGVYNSYFCHSVIEGISIHRRPI